MSDATAATTPRTWPEGAYPTPEQLLTWLRACTDAEGLQFAQVAVDAWERSSRCFIENHHGLAEEVRHLSRRASEAYDQGFNDAVDKALEAVADAD